MNVSFKSGAEFEHFVQVLVCREDSKAYPFGRPGPDGGQDILSGDRTLVYQAKHHEDGSATKVIRDAKREAEKIGPYRQEGHSRFAQWKSVSHWQLVTNAQLGPVEWARWDKEVVPLFKALEIEAELCPGERLEERLANYPDIERYFFGGEPRMFCSIGEARERFEEENRFSPSAARASMRGREVQLAELRTFLTSEKSFILIHGPGAVGKSRLALEFAEATADGGDWQVLWGLPESMRQAGDWFRCIHRERRTLLVIDDPASPDLLRQLSEQISTSVPWKVAVTARSPNDPVVKYLQSPGVTQRTHFLLIGPLAEPEAIGVATELLGTLANANNSGEIAELARALEGYPGWIAVAARVLTTQGSLQQLPSNIDELAAVYLDEVLAGRPECLRDLVRWLALLGSLNSEETDQIEAVRRRLSGIKSIEAEVTDLIRRDVVVRRGLRGRILEVKPDVFRDFILRDWLVGPGFGVNEIIASPGAAAIAAEVGLEFLEGRAGAGGRAVLASMARTETLLRIAGKTVSLLGEFFEKAKCGIAALSPSSIRRLIEGLGEIAPYYPSEMVGISALLRGSELTSEAIAGFGRTVEVGKREVVLDLAWLVFLAATGAVVRTEQVGVLTELYELAIAEGAYSSAGLPNDGRRAAALLKRVIDGGPDFRSQFDDGAREVTGRALAALGASSDAATLASAKAVLEAVTAAERTQSWSPSSGTISIRRVAVSPDSPAGRLRAETLAQIKARLGTSIVPADKRPLLWEILAGAHRTANQLRIQDRSSGSCLRAEVMGDLNFVGGQLGQLGLKDLSAARAIWAWHAQNDPDSEIRGIASSFEEAYCGNGPASEFEPLVGRQHWESHDANAARKASELAGASPERIAEFLGRAAEYVAATRSDWPRSLAWHLGQEAPRSSVVAQFIMGSVKTFRDDWRRDFVRIAAAGWVAARRKLPGELPVDRLRAILAAYSDVQDKLSLVAAVYDLFSIRSAWPQPDEINFLHSLAQQFAEAGRELHYLQIIGLSFDVMPEGFRVAAGVALGSAAARDRLTAIAGLAEGMAHRVNELDAPCPDGTGTWLLDQLAAVPRLYEADERVLAYIREATRRCGGPGVAWLVRTLRRRAAEEESSGEPYSFLGNEILAGLIEASDWTSAGGSLIKLAMNRGAVGRDMPDILRKVDPGGLSASLIAAMLGRVASEDDLLWLARCAGAMHGAPWRIVARPVLERALRVEPKLRPKFYDVLSHSRAGPFQFDPSTVPAHVLQELEEVKSQCADEREPAFQAYYAWRVECAQEEAERWEARVEEYNEQ